MTILLRSSIIGRVAPSLLSSRGGGGWNNGIASSSSFFTPTPTGRLLTAAATKFPSSIGNYFHNDEERIIERQQRQPTSGNLLSSWKSRMSIMPPRVVGTVLYNACISRLLPSAIIAKFTGDGTEIMNTIDILISSSEQQQQHVRDVDDQWIEKNEDNSTTTTTTTDTNAIQTTTTTMMMMMMEGGTRGQLLDLSIWLISTLKRRKKMMNKHKLRKRRKRLRLKTRK